MPPTAEPNDYPKYVIDDIISFATLHFAHEFALVSDPRAYKFELRRYTTHTPDVKAAHVLHVANASKYDDEIAAFAHTTGGKVSYYYGKAGQTLRPDDNLYIDFRKSKDTAFVAPFCYVSERTLPHYRDRGAWLAVRQRSMRRLDFMVQLAFLLTGRVSYIHSVDRIDLLTSFRQTCVHAKRHELEVMQETENISEALRQEVQASGSAARTWEVRATRAESELEGWKQQYLKLKEKHQTLEEKHHKLKETLRNLVSDD
jgi:hypothetical protein